MAKQWTLCESSDVLVAEFDEASFYYHKLTGETHLINAFPREILQLIDDQPLTADAIAGKLAALCDEEASLGWQRKVESVLTDLEKIQLVRGLVP